MIEQSIFKVILESLLNNDDSKFALYMLYVPFTLSCVWASSIFIFSTPVQKLFKLVSNITYRLAVKVGQANTSPYDNPKWVEEYEPYISVGFNYIFSLYFFLYAIAVSGLSILSEKVKSEFVAGLSAMGLILVLFVLSRAFKVAGDKSLYKIRSKT